MPPTIDINGNAHRVRCGGSALSNREGVRAGAETRIVRAPRSFGIKRSGEGDETNNSSGCEFADLHYNRIDRAGTKTRWPAHCRRGRHLRQLYRGQRFGDFEDMRVVIVSAGGG